jgi:hypothetical protein
MERKMSTLNITLSRHLEPLALEIERQALPQLTQLIQRGAASFLGLPYWPSMLELQAFARLWLAETAELLRPWLNRNATMLRF